MAAAKIPYGRQWIDDDDVAAVTAALRSDWLTTGPSVAEFERALAAEAGTKEAVAVSSGTAALHAAMHAIGIKPGDEVIVPSLTFAASANCVLYQGGTPVFADVDPKTLLVDPASVEARVTPRTRAILAVDYAGQPCDYDSLSTIARRRGLPLVADACHSLGAAYRGRPVGTLADLTVFSFHPVKTITTGEGGAVVTDDEGWARRMRAFRNHGISTDHHQREKANAWFYEMRELGFNYRLTDLQCALGLSQLRKLGRWVARRQALADLYDRAFAGSAAVSPLRQEPDRSHARHLYVVRLDPVQAKVGRDEVFSAMRRAGIGVNVHYVPVHFHPYYRDRFGLRPGLCPAAEKAYESILSLPLFPRMEDEDVARVVEELTRAARAASA